MTPERFSPAGIFYCPLQDRNPSPSWGRFSRSASPSLKASLGNPTPPARGSLLVELHQEQFQVRQEVLLLESSKSLLPARAEQDPGAQSRGSSCASRVPNPVSPQAARGVCSGDLRSLVPLEALAVSRSRVDLCTGRFTLSTRQFQWNCRSKSCPACSWSSFQMGTAAGGCPGSTLPGRVGTFPKGHGRCQFPWERRGTVPVSPTLSPHCPCPALPAQRQPRAAGRSSKKDGGNVGTQGG